jgi:SAM-dependent methyltransferase
MSLTIEIRRGTDEVLHVEPAAFDDFPFQDGDRLAVLPAEAAAALPVTWGDVNVEVAPGRAIRVPPVWRLFAFKGFQIPAHLIALTGAGPETFDLIGGAHLRNYQRTMGLFPDMHFVDVGCGIGRDAFQLMDHLSPQGRYLGVDVTRDSIAWCRRHVTARDARFTFHHVDAHNELYNPFGRQKTTDFALPVDDGTVDRIGLASVFTHLLPDEVLHYLREFRRVLKPGGLVHASFFLHSPEAIEAARSQGTTAWKATFEVPVGDGAWANDPQYPRGAVAYTDAAMRALMAEAGLATDRPYVKGAWSGLHGDAAEEGQDAVILRRA